MVSEIYSSSANNTASFRKVAQCLFLVLLEKLENVESSLKNLFTYHKLTFYNPLFSKNVTNLLVQKKKKNKNDQKVNLPSIGKSYHLVR